MSILSRIFGRQKRDRARMRPLWHRVVEIAREKQWYAEGGVADTVAGRFDAITLVLALVLLRMEREKTLIEPSVRLTEIFVDDMDGQLRQSGVGDLVVGKHMGKLMGTLGGRLGALRDALPQGEAAIGPVLSRNLTLRDDANLSRLSAAVLALHAQLGQIADADLLAGKIDR